MQSKLEDKTLRLFEYISQVYSIDLPVERDVTKHRNELWWQVDIIQSAQCKVKEFNEGNINSESELTGSIGEDAWLSVTKRSYDSPPELPSTLKDWVNLSSNPSNLPTPKPSILKVNSFDSDSRRIDVFKEYINKYKKWQVTKTGNKPLLPEILAG